MVRADQILLSVVAMVMVTSQPFLTAAAVHLQRSKSDVISDDSGATDSDHYSRLTLLKLVKLVADTDRRLKQKREMERSLEDNSDSIDSDVIENILQELGTEERPRESLLDFLTLSEKKKILKEMVKASEKKNMLRELAEETESGEAEERPAAKRSFGGPGHTFSFMPPMLELCRMMGLKRCH